MIDDHLEAESSRRRRRWLPFGIGALLIAVTIAGVSWLGLGMPRARKQPETREATQSPQMPTALTTARREALDAIQRLEVTVSFDEQKRVTAIEFRDSVGVWDVGRMDYRLTDTDLAHLKWFPEVQVVSIPGWPTSDRGVQHLRGLRELRKLNLCGATITDAGLAHLADMTRLEELDLMWAPISGSGLEHLKSLTGLRVLVLSFSTVTDRGLEHLQAFTRLEHLSLNVTPVTDSGLVHLRGLNRLKSLDLGNNTDITDAGLEHLKSLGQLRGLVLQRTAITDAGLEELRQALPHCRSAKKPPRRCGDRARLRRPLRQPVGRAGIHERAKPLRITEG